MQQDDQPYLVVMRILNPAVDLALRRIQIVLSALTPEIKRIHVVAVFRRFARALRGSIKASVGIARSEITRGLHRLTDRRTRIAVISVRICERQRIESL